MAFATKDDFCGLTTAFHTQLKIRESNDGLSMEKYQPVGEDGAFITTDVFGEKMAPSCTYGLKAKITATAGTVKLGKIATVGNKKFALQSITIGTAAASVVTVSANAVQVEDDADDSACTHFDVPAFTVDTKQVTQDIFSCCTVSGGSKTSMSATIACTVSPDDVAGVIISSDANSAVITVTGTILVASSSADAPTVTASEGWVVTKNPDRKNPEKSGRTFDFELQKILAVANS